jgi:hypothetical protein
MVGFSLSQEDLFCNVFGFNIVSTFLLITISGKSVESRASPMKKAQGWCQGLIPIDNPQERRGLASGFVSEIYYFASITV